VASAGAQRRESISASAICAKHLFGLESSCAIAAGQDRTTVEKLLVSQPKELSIQREVTAALILRSSAGFEARNIATRRCFPSAKSCWHMGKRLRCGERVKGFANKKAILEVLC
jgi:hypothetical protein